MTGILQTFRQLIITGATDVTLLIVTNTIIYRLVHTVGNLFAKPEGLTPQTDNSLYLAGSSPHYSSADWLTALTIVWIYCMFRLIEEPDHN